MKEGLTAAGAGMQLQWADKYYVNNPLFGGKVSLSVASVIRFTVGVITRVICLCVSMCVCAYYRCSLMTAIDFDTHAQT